MITKMHFQAAAKQVKDQFSAHKPTKKHVDFFHAIRENFVVLFAQSNPRFNADRFRDACTPDGAEWQAIRTKEEAWRNA
jgi:hypothetical protein